MSPAAPLSIRLASAVLTRNPSLTLAWHYETGLLWRALSLALGAAAQGPVRLSVDALVTDDGILTYREADFNLDQINPGRAVLDLWQTTGHEKYRRAADALRGQLTRQPRTRAGGFWHKAIYPHQMWLDGLYMASPFYAQYTALFGPLEAFDDVVLQFRAIEANARDSRTGLLYHGWDESRQQLWAHPDTGCSPHFWSRALGWFGMALVDTLDWLPEGAGHQELRGILNRWAEAMSSAQDASGLWYQVTDLGTRQGNYLESSGTAMVAYTLAKAITRGWLDGRYADVARRALKGLLAHKLVTDAQGLPSLTDVCAVAGLGGTPYRDGSFGYYVGEPVRADDPKGLGPLILAAVTAEGLGWAL